MYGNQQDNTNYSGAERLLFHSSEYAAAGENAPTEALHKNHKNNETTAHFIARLKSLKKALPENDLTEVSTDSVSDPNESVKRTKSAMFEFIQATNPAPNSYSTRIRSVDDIKTLAETLEDSD